MGRQTNVSRVVVYGISVTMKARPMPTSNSTSPPFPLTSEVGRKLIHLLALLLPIGMVVLPWSLALGLLLAGALLAVTGDIARVRSPLVAAWINRLFGRLMRPDEQPDVGEAVVLNGATWVMLSALLLFALFPSAIAAVALGLFVVADAGAALVGRRFGRRTWPGSHRTIEGSGTFWLVCAAGGLLLSLSALPLLALATAGAIAEALPSPLNDNLRAPLIMAATLWLTSPQSLAPLAVLLL